MLFLGLLILVHLLDSRVFNVEMKDRGVQPFVLAEGVGVIRIEQSCILMIKSEVPVFKVDVEFSNITELVTPNVRVEDKETIWYPLYALSSHRREERGVLNHQAYYRPNGNSENNYVSEIIVASLDPMYDLYGYAEGVFHVFFDLSKTLSIELDVNYHFSKYVTCVDYTYALEAMLHLFPFSNDHRKNSNDEETKDERTELTTVTPLPEFYLLEILYRSSNLKLVSFGILDICIVTLRNEETNWKFDVDKDVVSMSRKMTKTTNITPSSSTTTTNTHLQNKNLPWTIFENGTNRIRIPEPLDGYHIYKFKNQWKDVAFSRVFFRLQYVARRVTSIIQVKTEDQSPEYSFLEIGMMVKKDKTLQTILSILYMFLANMGVLLVMYILYPFCMLFLFVFYSLTRKVHLEFSDQNEPHIDDLLP